MLQPLPRWKKELPMWATYSRIFAGIILVGLLFAPAPWSTWGAAVLFVLASLTDWLDGFLARRYSVESTMGKFMDPITDKILVLCALIMLLHMQRVDPVMVILFIGRDIFIGGLRSIAAANSIIIAAKPFGKWKTALQMVAIPCLILEQALPSMPLHTIGYYGLWVSVGLSMISGWQYTLGYYRGRG